MVRAISLLVAAALISGTTPPPVVTGGCGAQGQQLGTCSITGEEKHQGNQGGGGGSGGGGQQTGDRPIPPPFVPPPLSNDPNCPRNTTNFCALPPSTPATPALPRPPVTLTDIATFRPVAPTATSEPSGGWTVLNRHTNFIASTTQHVVSGSLFDAPAEVRFTPVAYIWRHSDGTTLRTTTPGATWKQLHQPEFSRTDTSHAFTTKQTFTTELTVEYTAAYRIGGGAWTPIAGTVVANTAIPNQVKVFEIDTVLTTPEP